MRWLMITRKLDPDNDRSGFVMRWIEALAARLDHLDVICQEHANPTLPDNVTIYSMGKESGAGRLTQARRLTSYLRTLTPQVDGVFCHMIPRYVLFAAPWARFTPQAAAAVVHPPPDQRRTADRVPAGNAHFDRLTGQLSTQNG